MKKVRVYSLLVYFSLFFQFAQAQIPAQINSGNPAFPFPQFLDYGTDRKTLASVNAPGVTHAEMEQNIRDAWQIFVNGFVYSGETHAGVKYIKGNIGCPYDCSEGDGYAMLGAAYMADKTVFDGLWFRTHDLRRATKKKYNDCNATIRQGYQYGDNTLAEPGGDAATDGDLDIALALLMAWKQWGDNSGHNDACGNPISYKKEALEVIRGLVELHDRFKVASDCRRTTGNVGFDGYFKNGNTWGEVTTWANTGAAPFCPEFGGRQFLYVDYIAPSYCHAFADFLATEGGTTEDISWNIPQFRRAEASSDWIVGKHFSNSPTAILNAGQVKLDAANNATFTSFNLGEDFRFAWRTALNYVWHGNPSTTWNPTTHQTQNVANTYELDMAKRHSKFMANLNGAPWSNACMAPGGGPALTYSGPSQLVAQYSPTGVSASTFPLNWNMGTGTPSAIAAQDLDLLGKLYRQCVIEWDIDAAGDGYLTSVPKYFHGWFRTLGMLVASGNNHSPMQLVKESNVKVYHEMDKTYAFTGDQLVYTIKYRNYASVTANGVKITTTIPTGLQFVSATGGGTLSGNTVTWNVGTIPGFTTSGGITPTQGQVTLTVKVAPAFSGQICSKFDLTTTNGKGWTSNEYPNNNTAVMQRNCVDIVEKAMIIDKTANYNRVNPGQNVTYTINFENASKGGFINGGRPGVNIAYAHDGTAASTSQHGFKIRLYHGAVEPYIDYGNYRISMFLNDNTYSCIYGQTGCPGNGWVLDNDIYEGGLKTGVKDTTEYITPGSDARGSWNQRVIVRFANQLTTITPHVSRYYGIKGGRVHLGGAEPLRAKWRLRANNFAAINWSDDWSWNPAANDADGGLYYPITNDFTDINNPNIPVTDYHNEACQKPTKFVDNLLVEEWDGYTWRRILGNGPLPGRDVSNVVVTDVLPVGFIFGGFIDASGVNVGNTISVLGQNVTYTAATRTISWSIPKLQVKQKGTIKYIATAGFSSGTCSRADELQTNTASIVGTNETAVTDTANVTVTCTEVILPPAPSSMTKTANKSSYALAENVTYTLTYTNTNGSITNADLTSASKWTSQNGAAMTVSAGLLTNVSNDAGVMTYNQSHGTNGTIEASFNFANSAAFGIAFRHTGGAKANGEYVIFKPNPGAGSIEVRAYNGTTQVGTTQSIGYPGNPTNVKIELIGTQVNVWVGNTSNPTPTVTFTGFTVKAGYAGVINGWANDGGDSYGTHRLRSFKTHLDSAFDLELSDPVPSGITFTSASNSGTNTAGTVRFPVIAGPVLANAVTTRTWVGTVASCPTSGKIVNNAYANILGITTNSIAAQVIVSCGGNTCTPPATPTFANIVLCQGATPPTVPTPATSGNSYIWYTAATGTATATPDFTTANGIVRTYFVAERTPTNGGCESARKTFTFTVTANPSNPTPPTIAPICAGSTASLNKTGTATGSFYWYTSATGGTPNTNPFTTPVLSSNTTYYLIDSVANGCKSARTAVLVTVNQNPTAPTPPTVAPICAGNTASLNKTGTATGAFHWYTSATAGTPSANPFTTPVLNTNATYYLIDSVANGCKSARTAVVVTVNPKPTALFSFTPATGITTATNVTFNNTSTGAISYVWKIDGVQDNTNTTFSKTFATNKNYVVRLIATTANGCKDSTEQTVIVGVVPCTAPATPNISDVNLCQGDAAPTVPTPATANNTYIWYASANGTIAVTPDYGTNNTTPRTYFVAERTPLNGGCESAIRDQVTVTISPIPAPTVTTPFSQCGGTVNLATLTSTANVLFYSDTLAAALTNTVVGTSGVYYAQTTSTQNCKSKFISGKLDVTIKPVPVADVNPKTASYCGTGGSTLTATNAGTGATYEWFLGNSPLGNATTTNTLDNALEGSYTVKTTLDGCSSTSTIPAVVSVVTAIVPKISIKANSLDTCLGSAMVVNIFSQDNGTVQWFEDDIAQGTDNQHAFNLTKTTKIKVVLTSSESCANPKTAADSVTIVTKPLVTPTVSISPSAQDVCEGTVVNFSASPADGSNYEWYVGTVRQVGSSNTFSSNTLNNNDIVRVVYASPAVCASPKTAEASVPVSIQSKVVPSLVLKPTSLQVCAGENVTFEVGTQANQGTSPTYAWFVNNAPFTAQANATSITVPISATTNVYAVLTSSETCVSSPTANSDTLTVSVNTGVTPLVEITPTELALCGTSTGNFSISKIEGEGTNPGYQWLLNGNPIANAVSSSLTINTLSDGDKVSLALSSSSTCKLKDGDTSNVAAITIKAKPVATILQPVENNQTFTTSQQTVSIQADVAGGVWEKTGLGTLANTSGASNTLSQNTVGTTEIRWIMSDATGICPSDTAKIFVIYVDGPFANAGADAEKCESETVELKGQGSAGGVWTSLTAGATLTGTGANVTVDQKVIGINQFSYCVTDNSVNPVQKICDTVDVTIKPTVATSISISQLPTTGDNCQGDEAKFTAISSAGTITWSNGNTGTTATYTNWKNNDQVTATITSLEACASAATLVSNAIALNGTIKQTISLDASISGNRVFCVGEPVNLSASTASNLVTFKWKNPDGTTAITGESYAGFPTSSITLSLETSAPSGCYVNAGESKNMEVEIKIEPAASISNFGYKDLALDTIGVLCKPNKALFAFDGNSNSYQWYVNGNLQADMSSANEIISGLNHQDSVRVQSVSATCPIAKAAVSVIVDTLPLTGYKTPGIVFHCENQKVVLETKETNPNFSYKWKTTNATVTTQTPSYTIKNDTGHVTIKNGACKVKFPFEVRETNFGVKISASPAENFEPGESLELSAFVSGNIYNRPMTYLWSPANVFVSPNSAIVNIIPTETLLVKVTSTSKEGCEAKDSIELKKRNKLFIPNALTPESGDQNAAWNISGTENYPELDIKVFNRWGVLVHGQTGYTTPWDGNLNGKPLPAGTYYFVIKHRTLDKPIVGDLTIVR